MGSRLKNHKITKIAQKLCSKRLFVPFGCLNWHLSGKNDLFCRDWHEYVFSAEVIPRISSSLNIIIRNDSGQEKLSREAKLEDDEGLLARRPKEGMGMGEKGRITVQLHIMLGAR